MRDAIGTAPDDRAHEGRTSDVVFDALEAEHDVFDDAVPIRNEQRLHGGAVIEHAQLERSAGERGQPDVAIAELTEGIPRDFHGRRLAEVAQYHWPKTGERFWPLTSNSTFFIETLPLVLSSISLPTSRRETHRSLE